MQSLRSLLPPNHAIGEDDRLPFSTNEWMGLLFILPLGVVLLCANRFLKWFCNFLFKSLLNLSLFTQSSKLPVRNAMYRKIKKWCAFYHKNFKSHQRNVTAPLSCGHTGKSMLVCAVAWRLTHTHTHIHTSGDWARWHTHWLILKNCHRHFANQTSDIIHDLCALHHKSALSFPHPLSFR